MFNNTMSHTFRRNTTDLLKYKTQHVSVHIEPSNWPDDGSTGTETCRFLYFNKLYVSAVFGRDVTQCTPKDSYQAETRRSKLIIQNTKYMEQ
jgi:hypothetical protein